MALPPGIQAKTVSLGIASFADGSLASGRATISLAVNVLHTPSNRPIFSSDITKPFVDGMVSFDLLPTDAPGLNRIDWSYTLRVEIQGANVQPDVLHFLLPTAGPDVVDLDGLVTVPSSAGVPISVDVLTKGDFAPSLLTELNNTASATSVALRAASGSVTAVVTAAGALVAQKHNPVDATSGALTMTLPTGQPQGSQLSVEKADASTNTVTISGSLRGAAGTIALAYQRETVLFRADAAGSWWPVAGHRTKTSLDAAYVPAPNATVLSKVDRVLRSKMPPNRGIAVERAGTTYHLWQRLSQGQWHRTTLGTRTNTNGGTTHLISEYAVATPVVAVNDADASITYVNTWTSGSNAGAYGGTYRQSVITGATATYTTPALTTRVGAKVPRHPNGGLFRVTINGDATRAKLLPTAQELVEQGLYPATILTSGGGTLAATDRVIDCYHPSGRWDDTVVCADDLPPSAHVLVLTVTGYKRAASSDVRGYLAAIVHGQAQRVGDAGTITATIAALDPSPGSSATEYAISAKPSGGSYSFMGSIHDNEAEDSLAVAVDGAVTTVADATVVFPTGTATFTRVTRLLHPTGGLAANITTVLELNRDGVTVDVTLTWAQAMTVNAAYSMLPVMGMKAATGSTRRLSFDRGDLLENAEGPMRFAGTADVLRGVSKSAAAWVWNSTDHYAAGMWIENVGDFTQNWVNGAGMYASIQDRNGDFTKIYIARVADSASAPDEDVAAGSSWRWRAHYLFASLPSAEAVFG